jgi:NAD+--asparagine ADP-ribosyltransferase
VVWFSLATNTIITVNSKYYNSYINYQKINKMEQETKDYVKDLLLKKWSKIKWELDYVYNDSENILNALRNLGFEELHEQLKQQIK